MTIDLPPAVALPERRPRAMSPVFLIVGIVAFLMVLAVCLLAGAWGGVE
jgi:hypothetical protein